MDEKIGIIAGKGKLPKLIIEELNKREKTVYTAILKGFGDPELSNISFKSGIFKIGEVSKILKFFRDNKIKELIMAGKVEHINVFRDFSPDIKAFSLLKKLKSKNTLSIYSVISDFLESNNMKLVEYDFLLKEHIPPKGFSVGKISKGMKNEIDQAFAIAKRIAELDIGQAIAFKDGIVVGVEAIEGTDEMIKRVGKYVKEFFVVKVSNPYQSMSFDMPVVGSDTLKNIKKSGGIGLVVEGDKTIMLDFDGCMEYSKKQKLFMVAL